MNFNKNNYKLLKCYTQTLVSFRTKEEIKKFLKTNNCDFDEKDLQILTKQFNINFNGEKALNLDQLKLVVGGGKAKNRYVRKRDQKSKANLRRPRAGLHSPEILHDNMSEISATTPLVESPAAQKTENGQAPHDIVQSNIDTIHITPNSTSVAGQGEKLEPPSEKRPRFSQELSNADQNPKEIDKGSSDLRPSFSSKPDLAQFPILLSEDEKQIPSQSPDPKEIDHTQDQHITLQSASHENQSESSEDTAQMIYALSLLFNANMAQRAATASPNLSDHTGTPSNKAFIQTQISRPNSPINPFFYLPNGILWTDWVHKPYVPSPLTKEIYRRPETDTYSVSTSSTPDLPFEPNLNSNINSNQELGSNPQINLHEKTVDLTKPKSNSQISEQTDPNPTFFQKITEEFPEIVKPLQEQVNLNFSIDPILCKVLIGKIMYEITQPEILERLRSNKIAAIKLKNVEWLRDLLEAALWQYGLSNLSIRSFLEFEEVQV